MTTEQFIKDMNPQYLYEETGEYKMYFACDIPTLLKEFARVHVEKALQEAAWKAEAYNKPDYEGDGEGRVCIDRESILNAYPLTNII